MTLPSRVNGALSKARLAVACAELGCGADVDLDVAARPVLTELYEEGALERAVLLLARDDPSSRLTIAPRRRRGAPTAAELLEADHARLDDLLERGARLAQTSPARAQALIADFAAGARRHFRIEEELLFEWATAEGLSRAMTDRMERQHRAVLLYVERLVAASARLSDAEASGDALSELTRARCGVSSVLAQHNAEEEILLFPALAAHADDGAHDARILDVLLF